MSELPQTVGTEKPKFLKNPARLAILGWQAIKRRDQLTQIAYCNFRLRRDYSNCNGRLAEEGDYAISADMRGPRCVRIVEYIRETEESGRSLRRLRISNDESSKKLCDIEAIIAHDIPLGGGEVQTQVYTVSDGIRSQMDFPLAEIEGELSEIYKDAKPHLWPGNPVFL